MPSTRTLLLGFAVGGALFVLAAFTLLGLAGEALAALCLLGLALRGACSITARLRRVDPC